ncbi:type VI secretion system baseplate subunit TssF [Pseudoduganella albidiflava]|uniref:Type VI secretion system baseplate subunit TssF n=1 Tax=Pseudoduganella albidiflava TaxID=321983 RepID=A0A411X6Q8_9BURK|nr:type VI secretion system baseplate subunit TssF [Pseudoduganella albidiflava]QBI04669.1 type VI secretion system baseplate subunit TssF [Pseudoduganella albidiflava]GGY29103.1 hypothetical protein GCM10007387_09180 [Pseudoduganella albidiflava]
MDRLLQQRPGLADTLAPMPDPVAGRPMQAASFRNADAWLPGALRHSPPPALPSCSVVQVESAGNRPLVTIPRGTELTTKAQPACRFRTIYDVAVAPLAIATARFVPCVDMPPTLGVPAGAACAIVIAIESTDPAIALDDAAAGPIRLFIDADPATRAALHDALFTRTLCTCVQAGRQWTQLAALPFAPVGCAADEALLPAAADRQPVGPSPRERHGLRLLAEYFAFPEKFDFFDIDLAPALARCPAGTLRLVLHVLLPALPSAGSLQSLAPSMLRLGCTPVVNLFSRAAEPLPIAAQRNTYPLRAFPLAEADASLYSVDAVTLLQAAGDAGLAIELPRFVALRRVQADRYWLVRHAGTAGGPEATISFVDSEQRPLALRGGTVAVQLTCTNGDAPASLPIGRPDGDLTGSGAAGRYPARFLRRPSTSSSPASQHGRAWRHSAAHASGDGASTQAALPALLALLRLHAPADSAAVQRQLAGIVSLDQRAVKAWLRFPQGAAYMHGTEVRLAVDVAAFDRSSVFVFAQVMEWLFAGYAGEEGFTRLVVVDLAGRELVRCAARAGGVLPV